jgi:cytochrome c-type biogenesis protein CcmH/NrfF
MFRQLPLFVRVVVGIALINLWVSFEEFVVDRVGLWKYMPGYKVGMFCLWDLAVVLLVIAAITWASVKREAVIRRS